MLSDIKSFIKLYAPYLKRGFLIFSGIFMLVAVQTYVNYITIIEKTLQVEEQTKKVKDEISYFNNFQLKYLNSAHAKRLLAHENNILEPWEAVILFKAKKEPESKELLPAETLQNTPREERKSFFSQKISAISPEG